MDLELRYIYFFGVIGSRISCSIPRTAYTTIKMRQSTNYGKIIKGKLNTDTSPENFWTTFLDNDLTEKFKKIAVANAIAISRTSLTRTPKNIERVRLAIEGDRRLTVRELKNDLGILKTTVSAILNKILGMTRVCAKFIPKLLTTEQKDLSSEITQDNLKWSVMMKISLRRLLLVINHGFMVTILKLNTNLHSGSVQTSHGQKTRQSRSHVKSMLIIFFDCEGVVQYELAPRGQTINKEYYVEVLKRLRYAVRRKRPCFWSSGDWLLHHDNAPAHSSNLVQQFLAKHKIVQLSPASVQSRHSSLRLLDVPKIKNGVQRKADRRHRDDSE